MNTKTCMSCGELFESNYSRKKYCDAGPCRSAMRAAGRKRYAWTLPCQLCGHEYEATRKDGKYCPGCRGAVVSASRSPENSAIYEAVRSGSTQDVLNAILGRCVVTDSGCWEWQGFRGKAGYGYVSTGRSRRRPQENTHRVTYEYSTGISAEGMTVHHKCANPPCCNPDHLQLATHGENMAEMHARRSYEARIKSLEEALKSVAPDHPLLVG